MRENQNLKKGTTNASQVPAGHKEPLCQILDSRFRSQSKNDSIKNGGFRWKCQGPSSSNANGRVPEEPKTTCQTNALHVCLGCQVMKGVRILRSVRMLTLQSSCHTMHFAKPIETRPDQIQHVPNMLQHTSSGETGGETCTQPMCNAGKGLDNQNACESLSSHLTCLEMSSDV